MALRVKKLARRLSRRPEEVLGLLRAIGFRRYSSAEDMLPGQVIRRIEQAIREGVQPIAVPGAASRPHAGGPPPAPEPDPEDVMATLVPGVVPLGGKPESFELGAQTTYVEALLGEDQETEEEHPVAFPLWSMDEPTEIGESPIELELSALRAEVDRLSAALREAKERLAEVRQPPSVRDLLYGRGLRGFDELERALGGLAQKRLLLEAIGGASLADRGQFTALLANRVVLAEEAPLEGLPDALVAVAVAPERAEVPQASVLDAQVRRLGEEMLLCGRKSLGLVGPDPVVSHLVASRLDPRIELLRGGFHGMDADSSLVVLWNGVRDPRFDQLVSDGAIGVRGEGGFRALLDALLRALAP